MPVAKIEVHHSQPGMHLLPGYEIETDTAWTYVPFVTTQGQVGVMLKSNDADDREEFIYFNPSAEGDPKNANVFVYHGTEGSVHVDGSEHFYPMGQDWTEPT